MKFGLLLLAITLGFTTAQAANNYQLKSLACAASNGVKIETVKHVKEDGQDALEVKTTLGGVKKNFVASLAGIGFGYTTGVFLKPVGYGPSYIVNLDLSPKVSRVQKVDGNLQLLVNRYQAMTIATVVCNVQIIEE